MKWQNVKLIFNRELRDQLRDRRTLFTVAIMPMVLYPLMGMAMLQVAQFMREYPTKIWVVGMENLPEHPSLFVDGQVNLEYVSETDQQLIDVQVFHHDAQTESVIRQLREQTDPTEGTGNVNELIQQEMQKRGVDVTVVIPAPITNPALPDRRSKNLDQSDDDSEQSAAVETQPYSNQTVYVFQNSASDKSRLGAERLNGGLMKWKIGMVRENLTANDVPISMVQGVTLTNADVADKSGKQAAAWSKILPFIIMIWSLTGAFYPAIDLCAGEKERGTFETLLSSPAARSEIAIGKLLTVISFSMATSLLNLLSMGFTGMFVVSRLGAGMPGGLPMGAPPLSCIGWLLLALIPISALFSAVALAAAAFARSSKEGQYYLVPLMMISMPLMMIPMLPAAELDLGTSLIPVSGLMLMLRGLIEGQYAQCIKFAGPVCGVTLVCCWLSIRWVVRQFNSETVLFRASERFGVGVWLKFIMQERHELPSLGNAMLCFVVILVAKFFIGFVVQTPDSFAMFTKQTVIILIATMAVPAVMMALVLTRNARKSLRLRSCTLPMASAAILAAIFLNPLFTWFAALVMQIYPPTGDLVMMEQTVSNILTSAPGLWAIILVFAAAPAVIEELAFRGFILSGLQSLRSKWQAILISAVLFGIAHGVIQQTLITTVVGFLLGIIAIQTRSIIPCMLFHLTHNSLAVLLSSAKASVVENSFLLRQLLHSTNGESYQYSIAPGILMSAIGVLLMAWFIRLDATPTMNRENAGLTRLIARMFPPKSQA
ncbi:MAG: ABC transporter permease subunit [Mariniblastus sp.]|nr:ABC transporter permease subunit [Mariniblastus sp.]